MGEFRFSLNVRERKVRMYMEGKTNTGFQVEKSRIGEVGL